MTPRELLNAIKLRAYALTFASEGKVSFAQAKRQAAQEVAKQERDKRSLAVQQSSTAAPTEITVSNARRALLARLSEIGSRLKATAGLEDTPSPKPQIRKHVLDLGIERSTTKSPAPSVAPQEPEPEQPPTHQVVGIIYGTGVATTQRIPDEQFHTSVQSPVTQAWHASIRRNEAIAREKQQRSRWIG
jgi:hypothetical protein